MDFTYVWTAGGWLSVLAVIDLLSRHVVGWSLKAEMTVRFVKDDLIVAIWKRGRPDPLLRHIEQGRQHTSRQVQKLMADDGVKRSINRSGNVLDNAAEKGLFCMLKTKRTARSPTTYGMSHWWMCPIALNDSTK